VIPLLAGWRLDARLGSFTLRHPAGADAGTVTYRERMAPLRPLGVLVRDFLSLTPSFTDAVPAPPERMVTLEGEHAALVVIAGRERAAPALRVLGFVLTEDFFSCTSGVATRDPEALVPVVRALVRADLLALGVRRRRFDYAPPPDWEPLARGLTAEWVPPGFPNDGATITVYPATPRLAGAGSVAALAAGFGPVVAAEAPEPVRAQAGLTGEARRSLVALAGGRRQHREIIVLDDGRHNYALGLSAGSADAFVRHRPTFQAVAASVEPVPAPSPELATEDAVRQWLV
jgi:hypothetical protein